MTQFADNIRRIARGNRKKGALGIYTERDPVPGGTVFLVTNPDLLNGNAPATSNGSNSPEAQEEADEDKNTETDPNDPNTFNKGGTGTGDSAQQEGVADVGDAIDGNAGPSMPSTGGGTSGTGGLRELTGLRDCDSDKEFNLHLDGNFVPPEGWDDPDTPPIDDTFVANTVWVTGSGDPEFWGFTYSDLESQVDAYLSSCGTCAGFFTSFQGFSGGWITSQSDALGKPTFRQRSYFLRNSATSGDVLFTFTIKRVNCESSESVSVAGDCISELSAESWPVDEKYDVAIKDGQFQTNQYDADAPDNFEPRGTIDFCYGDGKTGRSEVTADGGTIIYETIDGGAPTGIARVLDSSGQLVAAGDATDSFISQYLPQ